MRESLKVAATNPAPEKPAKRTRAAPYFVGRPLPAVSQPIDDGDKDGNLEEGRYPAANQEPNKRPDETNHVTQARQNPGHYLHGPPLRI